MNSKERNRVLYQAYMELTKKEIPYAMEVYMAANYFTADMYAALNESE